MQELEIGKVKGLNDAKSLNNYDSLDNIILNEVQTFLKEAITWLLKEDCGCATFKLDDHLAICVGWSAGYGKEKREDVVQSKRNPDYALNAGLKVWTSDCLRTDYDFINFPYLEVEEGDVIDYSLSIKSQDIKDCDELAKVMLNFYNEFKYNCKDAGFEFADDHGLLKGIEERVKNNE